MLVITRFGNFQQVPLGGGYRDDLARNSSTELDDFPRLKNTGGLLENTKFPFSEGIPWKLENSPMLMGSNTGGIFIPFSWWNSRCYFAWTCLNPSYIGIFPQRIIPVLRWQVTQWAPQKIFVPHIHRYIKGSSCARKAYMMCEFIPEHKNIDLANSLRLPAPFWYSCFWSFRGVNWPKISRTYRFTHIQPHRNGCPRSPWTPGTVIAHVLMATVYVAWLFFLGGWDPSAIGCGKQMYANAF